MTGTSGAVMSPAKRRHRAVRPHLTLPALHHFEPVLRSSPRASDSAHREDGPGSDALASSPPIKPRSVDKESPRVRPVPPPPTGITSRTDLELFRYSQHVKQRLAIRPLFEQRREEEADVARRILATREGTAKGDRQEELTGTSRTTTPSKPGTRPPSRGPSPAPSRPKTRERELTADAHPERSPEQLGGDAESEIVTVRFRTPTPPASAKCSRPKTPTDEESLVSDVAASDERPHADIPDRHEDAPATTTEESDLRSPSAAVANVSTLHAPFLDSPGPMLSWLRTTSLAKQVAKKSEVADAVAKQPVMCYKMLWKDQALRWLRRRDAVEARIQGYLNPSTESPEELDALHEGVQRRIAAATAAKLQALAIASIVDDMITDFIALESRMELHHAKFSGGYDDFYASKVQATYRMSTKRREYLTKKHVRQRAARLIQALQRGILARRRYVEMRVEREKYLFYGFRSSLHDAAARIEDPRARAMAFAKETERRRHNFLMQVLHGYVAQNGLPVPVRLARHVLQHLFNEYGIVVGCSATFGNAVGAVLLSQHRQQLSSEQNESAIDRDPRGPWPQPTNERLYSSTEIQAALVVALRSQYDDTFGLSSDIRQLAVSPRKTPPAVVDDRDQTPPRWLLKVSPPFQRANRHRLAAQRLTRSAAGRRAAHLVALDYRTLLSAGFASFESSRAAWEANIRSRVAQAMQFDAFSLDELVQYALDRLVLAVKDWGLDPEPLFEALNLGLQHRLGRQMLCALEQKFNAFADGVNAMHGGKSNVYTLREEISQELEEFEQLLALRCLNIARDNVVTVAPSEVLFVALRGRVDPEYLRHALPTILPIASVKDKFRLARKLMHAYANASYGDAFNSVCWSCLDSAENVTVEAAQFLDRLTRRHARRLDDIRCSSTGGDGESDDDDGDATPAGDDEDEWQSVDWQHGGFSDDETRRRAASAATTVAGRALYLLTGSHALRFLQFLAKVAHFNKAMQRRVLLHLAPHAERHELYRLASVLCALDSFELVTRLFGCSFDAATVYGATRFWVQYETDFGLERAEQARASGAARPVDDERSVQATPDSG
ncbi:hypothetical protein P43SY_010917 [Pythium insidiosum]|uniref:Uncharacterized protein n=1 Tax=Pythium insidiosum TaxID=114742 RepID=A0AAD5Q7E2_PYTIN|nr:hypothetical protein P43SY_010917 [Pythium insidiosum]